LTTDLVQEDWRRALWSSLTIEFLMRAVLAHVSPALLAERIDRADWHNVYFALGHTPSTNKFVPRSMGAREVIRRLQALLPEFTSEMVDTCATLLDARNEELHSGGIPFNDMRNSSWMPSYYSVCATLLSALGYELRTVFGKEEAAAAATMIEALRDDRAERSALQ
jgi:hypothetical protein